MDDRCEDHSQEIADHQGPSDLECSNLLTVPTEVVDRSARVLALAKGLEHSDRQVIDLSLTIVNGCQ